MDTSGWALIMACRRERCGSSVYVQKNLSSIEEGSGGGIRDGSVDVFWLEFWFLAADTRKWGDAVAVTDDMAVVFN